MTVLLDETRVTPGERRTETEKVYDAAVLARVKAGIAWLEEKVGPDWVDLVNLDALDLADGARCVLGQVFAEDAREAGDEEGFTFATLAYQDELPNSGMSHGFYEGSGWGDRKRYAPLQACWKDVLTPLVEKR